MGLLKAGLGALTGTLADQWKEFFTCDAIPADVLVVKGQKKTSSRSSNTKGSDNVISNGSVITVADGQCMLITEQGKIVEVCAEPGQFVWDTSTEPSIFAGSLGSSILDTFKEIGQRFTFGGQAAKDQRVYYVNTKEILGNKFGTANPVPFRVVDSRINLDVDVSIRCNGTFSYRIADPLKFYSKITGNVSSDFSRTEIDPDLKAAFLSALQPALARLSDMELRPNQIIAHTAELEQAVNEVLSSVWGERGILVERVSLGSVTLPDEDAQMIKDAQKAAMYRDASYAAATLVEAQSTAMKDAAKNTATGPAMAFMNMNAASNAGGASAADLFQIASQQQAQQAQTAQTAQPAADSWVCPSCGKTVSGKFCPECGAKKPEPKAANSWKCPNCGKEATGKFCPECGAKKPEEAVGWICPDCGTVNKGKFCSNCGAKKPAAAPLYRCDKCGWEPEDPTHPPKFCPECGDIFDDSDIK